MKAPDFKGRTVLPVEELDGLIDVPSDAFEARCRQVWRALDRHGVRLAHTPVRPIGPPASSVKGDVLGAYRAEIAKIPPMSREEGYQLARRVEFARRRLQAELKRQRKPDPGIRRLFEQPCLIASPGTTTAGEAADCGSAGGVLRHRCCELQAFRNDLVERGLSIVTDMAIRYRGVGLSSMDLIQEGNASLFRAVEGYDWRRGVLFRTYASHWVNQAFLNLIYNHSRTVRVPAYIQKAMKKIRDAGSRIPLASPDELALSEESGVPLDLVRATLGRSRATLSLDRPAADTDGAVLGDLIPEPPPEEGPVEATGEVLVGRLGQAMEALNDRGREVLRLRYGLAGEEPHTLAQVGARMGISLERVRQIQLAAIEKLRAPSLRRMLED